MKLIIQYDKYFFMLFSFFLIIYGFNNIEIIKEFKITLILLIPIFIIYFTKKKYIISYELKIGLIILFLFLISTINTMINYDNQLMIVLNANFKILIIFLMLILFYNFYYSNPHYFDIYIPIFTTIFMISNIIYYFFFYDFLGRFEGTFGGSNEFAYMLVFYIYLLYYFLFKYDEKINKIISLVIIPFVIIGLHLLVIITLSRGALVGLLIFYLISFIYFYKKISIFKKLIIVLTLIISVNQFYTHFEKSVSLLEQRFINKEGKSSLNSRIYEIDAAINLLNQNLETIILGNGTSFSSDEVFYKNFYTSKLTVSHRIHNSYFALIVENGILTFLLFIYLIIITLKNVIKVNSNFKYIMLGYVIFSLFFMIFIYIIYFLPFWFSFYLINLHSKQIYLEENKYDTKN